MTEQNANLIINILFHMTILVVFLTILFYIFISKTEKKAIESALVNALKKEIPIALAKIDEQAGDKIPWDKFENATMDLKNKYKGKIPQYILDHNKQVFNKAIALCLLFFTFVIISIVYYYFIKGYKINFLFIISENLVTTVLIGIIEVIFFLKVAFKYIPITTSEIVEDSISRLQYQINNMLLNENET